jgi:hypothetical protein
VRRVRNIGKPTVDVTACDIFWCLVAIVGIILDFVFDVVAAVEYGKRDLCYLALAVFLMVVPTFIVNESALKFGYDNFCLTCYMEELILIAQYTELRHQIGASHGGRKKSERKFSSNVPKF